MPRLPSYDELPVRPDAPAGSSWGVWGDGDVLGCLNLLTPERVAAAAALVRTGAMFALNLDVELPDPPLYGRAKPLHTVHTSSNGHDDELSFNTQSSSQWDGFRHIRNHHGFYGGVADEDHGIHHWARRGIAGRGVLLDLGRWREAQGRPFTYDACEPIDAADLEACAADQGVAVGEGDILLLRTGWVGWYRDLDPDRRRALATDLAAPGLRPGVDTARRLWDWHVAAVAADNPALEAWPPGGAASPEEVQAARDDPDRRMDLFVHVSLIPALGIPIGELWDLEALAASCADDGRYECFLTSAPLNVRRGVASPPNALAIK